VQTQKNMSLFKLGWRTNLCSWVTASMIRRKLRYRQYFQSVN